jgi:hypothetical protein
MNGPGRYGRRYTLLLMACQMLVGCAATRLSDDAAGYGFEGASDRVWVKGPWEEIHPSKDIDEVIDQLCPAVMKLPRVQSKDHGQEYCGVLYKLLGADEYYASLPSPLGRPALSVASRRKSCLTPKSVRDPRGASRTDADFHSHPWSPSGMSGEDKMLENQWYLFRIQLDSRCRIQKLVPHAGEERPGELYERQGKSWRLVGFIMPEDKESGYVTPAGD